MTTPADPVALRTPGAMRYARVAIGRPLDQPYTYLVPDALSGAIHVGSLVEVPLRNDTAEGVVVDISSAADVPARVRNQIKPIARLLTPGYTIERDLIELGRWMAEYYFCSLGEALATISMVGLNDVAVKTQTHLALVRPERWLKSAEQPDEEGRRPTAAHQRVIRELLADGNRPIPPAELRELAGVGDAVLRRMMERGWLERVEEAVYRLDDDAPEDAPPAPLQPPFELTQQQKVAHDALVEALRAAQYQAFLLHGVTGSGKTEIYLRVMAETLRLGRTGIVLVPEISLTPQIVDAFRRRLGRQVGVYHSKLSLGQKLDLYRLIRANEIRVVIGARSALFAPLPRLGLIIVDEEHETSFKQGETPRYHARDVAVMRAARAGALVVLGSATPSIETLHNVREGKYRRLSLPQRIGPHSPPQMVVVDMRRHIAHGTGPIDGLLSPTLRSAIQLRLERGEQTVLLLNRRGFANHVLCLKCETQLQCPNCDISMTYHKTVDRLMCHWCGHRQPLPQRCPKCDAEEIQVLGFGTQRVEEVLAEAFPDARLLRIDLDSTRRKGAFREAWRRISNREIDIILGTQMIAKGLHLEAVTLVGVISADFALFLPDFRAAERTYQLLTQVAGRAGRGGHPGEVIVQTFMPHHYAIDCAARLAETEFYEKELRLREIMRFPPFSRLAALIVSGEDEQLVRDQAWQLAGVLKRLVYRTELHEVHVLGPTPAPIARIEKQHRWRLLARSARVRALHEVLRRGLADFAPLHKSGKVNLTVDIDPIDLL